MMQNMTRIPEAEAPNLRSGNIRVDIDATVPADANGVIFALIGYAGGASMFVVDGELHYEYSSLLLKRTKVNVGKHPVGDVRISMEMHTPQGWAVPAELTFWIDGEQVKQATIERTIPAGFPASETFDISMDTASPVADAYFERAPFSSNAKLKSLYFKHL